MVDMVKHIPNYMGYDDADSFMTCFIDNLSKIEPNTIREIIKLYNNNSQCTNRGRHSTDIECVEKYLSTLQV